MLASHIRLDRARDNAEDAIARRRGGELVHRATTAEVIEDWRAVAEELSLSDSEHAWLLAEDLLYHQKPMVPAEWAAGLAVSALRLTISDDPRAWFPKTVTALLFGLMNDTPAKRQPVSSN